MALGFVRSRTLIMRFACRLTLFAFLPSFATPVIGSSPTSMLPSAAAATAPGIAGLKVAPALTPDAPPTPSAATGDDLASTLDAVVSEWLAANSIPSVSIAIVQGGRLIYAHAYGLARVQPAVAAETSSRYAIDSLTKEFTAAAILWLAERGKLSLDEPIARWFPDLGAASHITPRQLLTHTSGIRDYWPQDFVTPAMAAPTTPAAIIQSWAQRPLDFEPGTQWQYSNTGYVLAAAIVERVSGEKFLHFLQHQVFMPLRLNDAADDTSPLSPQDAGGYTRHGLGPVRPAPPEGAGWLFGASNLSMSARDVAVWDMSLIDRTLLRATSYDTAFTPIVLGGGSAIPYGLGLDVEQVDGRLRIGHSGSGSGFLADNRVWPSERTAIVVLTNNDWASPAELSRRIAFLVLTPTPAEARARAVFAGLQAGSVDRTQFTAAGNFYFDEGTLRDLRASLNSLGPIRDIELERESLRGGMITRRWRIRCADARLRAIERGYPGGKLEEFMITRPDD